MRPVPKQPAPDPRHLTLRQRNRLATRDAIAEAAMQIAEQRGLDGLRIEDIARVAGVSPRTFSNYFANKYDALIACHVDGMHHAAAALRTRPGEEPLWQVIQAAILSRWDKHPCAGMSLTPAALAELRLLFGDRNLQAAFLKAGIAEESEFALAIAERTGLDVTRDLYPGCSRVLSSRSHWTPFSRPTRRLRSARWCPKPWSSCARVSQARRQPATRSSQAQPRRIETRHASRKTP